MFDSTFAGYFSIDSLLIYGQAFVFALVVFVVVAFIKRIVVTQFSRIAEKTATKLDDALVPILDSVQPFVFGVIAFAAGGAFLSAPPFAQTVLNNGVLIAVVYQVVVSLGRFTDVIIRTALNGSDAKNTRAVVSFATTGTKVVVWIVGFLIVFSNLGINITSLIAGLGIGGVAIAFALQRILSDLFSSFAIYLDRPFEVGDTIIVGENIGKVERIGLKTTRIRALQGEQIIIPNETLTSSRVQNFKQMNERRVVINVGVLYETPHRLLKDIPRMIREIIELEKKVRFDRVHLNKFGDSAILFEIVYYVLSGDYTEYMDVQERILFGIKEAFDEAGISFAYPTHTVYVKK